MKPIGILIIVLTSCLLPAMAQNAGENTAAYRASVSQTALQGSTARMNGELADIIRDYGHYEIASLEILKLKEAVSSLGQITNRDMPDVVRLLLEASRSDAATARGNLTKADGCQKDIQTRLRALADQLALYADQSAMQQRIEDLAVRQAANLRATRKLTKRFTQNEVSPRQLENEFATTPPRPDSGDRETLRTFERKLNLWTDYSRRKIEQTVLEKETGLAVAALTKVVDNPMAASATHFKQALEAATAAQITDRSRLAVAAMNEDLSRAGTEQQILFNTLQSMLACLDAAKSDEERLRDIATQLGDLALKERGLANLTPRMWGEQKNRATQDQLAVADHLEVQQSRLKTLNSEISSQAAAAANQAGNLGEQLKTDGFTDNIPLVSQTADSQQSLAQSLTAMREQLEQQADQLAAKNLGKASSVPDPQLSPEAAAIQAAMLELVDARINVDLAGRLNDGQQDYQTRLALGRQNITNGSQQARSAGAAVGEEVHQALAEADKLAQLAAAGDKVGHHLFHTRANINRALEGLQNAANLLAAKEAKDLEGNDGESLKSSPSMKGGAVYSNLANASEAQRDALSLLKQEQIAPEFEPMVNQYIKSLAEEPEDDR